MTRKTNDVTNEKQLKLFDNKITDLWTVKEVASYLHISVGHIYNLVSKDEIPYRKRGNILRFVPQEIFDWINEGGL